MRASSAEATRGSTRPSPSWVGSGPGDRHQRKPTWSEKTPDGRWRSFGYDELLARDKVSLDAFWLRDESLEDSANLPDPNILAEEIAEDLRAALEQVEDILGDLRTRAPG